MKLLLLDFTDILLLYSQLTLLQARRKTVTDTQKVPGFMNKGSEGPGVDLVILFLISWAKKGEHFGETGLVADGIFGETACRWLKAYQTVNGIPVAETGVGPKTREQMKVDDFDFEERLAEIGDPSESTLFCRDDGTFSIHPH